MIRFHAPNHPDDTQIDAALEVDAEFDLVVKLNNIVVMYINAKDGRLRRARMTREECETLEALGIWVNNDENRITTYEFA